MISLQNKYCQQIKVLKSFPFFFAFFNTNNNIHILNNMIYFVPWLKG